MVQGRGGRGGGGGEGRNVGQRRGWRLCSRKECAQLLWVVVSALGREGGKGWMGGDGDGVEWAGVGVGVGVEMEEMTKWDAGVG